MQSLARVAGGIMIGAVAVPVAYLVIAGIGTPSRWSDFGAVFAQDAATLFFLALVGAALGLVLGLIQAIRGREVSLLEIEGEILEQWPDT